MTNLHRTLYQQIGFPVLQNRLFETREAARSCTTGDIHLVQDGNTGLVYNAAFDQSRLCYDSTYHNEQEYSVAFKEHLSIVADLVERNLGKVGLVEIGCGKGYFFDMLATRGCEIRGFDPTYEGENPKICKTYFDPLVSLDAKAIVLRHVLEHVPDPVNFLTEIRGANSKSGLIYIEVPCFDWICDHRAWFDVFYEHVNYFRLEDFGRIFGQVLSCGHLFGGQYLYCIAELRSLRDSPQAGWTIAELHPGFAPSEQSLRGSGNEFRKPKQAVWGCASKGVIYSLLRDRANNPIDVAIDINPKKHGFYLPGSGVQVLAPAIGLEKLPPGSTVFVMNPMYVDEIKAQGGGSYKYVCFSNSLE